MVIIKIPPTDQLSLLPWHVQTSDVQQKVGFNIKHDNRASRSVVCRLVNLRTQLIRLLVELRACCVTSSDLRSLALIVRRKCRVEGMLWELKHLGTKEKDSIL